MPGNVDPFDQLLEYWDGDKYRFTEACFYSEPDDLRASVSTICSLLSMISYAILAYEYFVVKQPALWRQPTDLHINLCMFEFLYVFPYLFVYWLPLDVLFEPLQSNHDTVCRATWVCYLMSFFAVVGVLGSHLYFIMILHGVHMQCSNPFASLKFTKGIYSKFVVAASVSMAIVLMIISANGHYAGLSSDRGVWIQDFDRITIRMLVEYYLSGTDTRTNNFVVFTRFAMSSCWSITAYIYALFVIFFVSYRLKEGMASTMETRRSLAYRCKTYVIGNTLYLGLMIVVFIYEVMVDNNRSVRNDSRSTYLHTVFAGCIALRGLVSMIVILYTNFDELLPSYLLSDILRIVPKLTDIRNETIVAKIKKEIENKPHLNAALRNEVLMFTTGGIRAVIEEFIKYENDKAYKLNAEYNYNDTTKITDQYPRLSIESVSVENVKASRSSSLRNSSFKSNHRLSMSERHSVKSAHVNSVTLTFNTEDDDDDEVQNSPNYVKQEEQVKSELRSSIDLDLETLNYEELLETHNKNKSIRDSYSSSSGSRNSFSSGLVNQANSNDSVVAVDAVNDLLKNGPNPRDSSKRMVARVSTRRNSDDDEKLSTVPGFRSTEFSEVELSEYESFSNNSSSASITRDTRAIDANARVTTTSTDTKNTIGAQKARPRFRLKSVFQLDAGSQIVGGTQLISAKRLDGGKYDEDLKRVTQNLSSVDNSGPTTLTPSFSTSSFQGSNTTTSDLETGDSSPSDRHTQSFLLRNTSGRKTEVRRSQEKLWVRTKANSKDTGEEQESFLSSIYTMFYNLYGRQVKNYKQRQNFTFKDYCPELFGEIRTLSGIKHQDYIESLSTTTKERFSEGQSGSFLYFSGDMKYIVKTLTREDRLVLVRILPYYVAYLQSEPNSLIVRFFGCHSIMMYGQRINFVVMQNAFTDGTPDERYDLKGSWINRHGDNPLSQIAKTKGTVANTKRMMKTNPLFKDSDLLRPFVLEPFTIELIRAQLTSDSIFLASHNIMDYSLLVGVKRKAFTVMNNQRNPPLTPTTRNSTMTPNFSLDRNSDDGVTQNSNLEVNLSGLIPAAVVEGPELYSFAIIDVLQEWNWNKQIEHWVKVWFKCYDPHGLSAIPAWEYSARFLRAVAHDSFQEYYPDEDDQLASLLSGNQKNSILSQLSSNLQRGTTSFI